MRGLRVGIACALLVGWVCLRANAEAPALPPEAIGPETFLVIQLDVSKANPDAARRAARAALGPMVQQIGSTLDEYQQRYPEYVSAGIEQATMVVSGKNVDDPSAVLHMRLKKGANAERAQQLLDQTLNSDGKSPTSYEKRGDYIVAYQKGQAPAKVASAERARLFADALASPTDPALVIAFAMTPTMHDQATREVQGNKEIPADAKEVIPGLLGSKWLAMGVTLGRSPAVSMTLEAGDTDAAKKLADKAAAGMDMIRQNLAKTMQGADVLQQQMITDMVNQLQPKQDGSKLKVQVSGPGIAVLSGILLPAINVARHKANEVKAARDMGQLAFAVQMYADEHKGRYPDSLGEVKMYLGGDEAFNKMMENPHTESNPGYEYVKPAATQKELRGAARTPMIYELENGQRVETGIIAFADGTVRHPTGPSRMARPGVPGRVRNAPEGPPPEQE